MSLYDKFKIIENHLQNEDKTKIISKIENYFENLLISDTHVLVADYINQIIWFDYIKLDGINGIGSLNVHIKNYLIQRRNNMRLFIKKDTFEFSNLNKFLKNFIIKIEYLNNIMKSPDNKIIKEGIKQLTNLIISDSLIMLFIEEQVILLDKNLKSDIEILFNLTKTLGKYDNYEIFNKILKTIGNVYKKHLVNMEDYPLPDNIKKIQKFCDNIKFCNEIKTYYKFIGNDFNTFSSPIIHLIVENLIVIIQSNTLDEIGFTLDNIWNDFAKLVLDNKFENKEIIFNILFDEIINLLNKLLKPNNINIFKLINLLKYIDQIVDNQLIKDIINQKISTALCSDNLIDQIHITINDLICDEKSNETIKLLKFVLNIKNKDIFIAKYYEFLTKRLMCAISKFNSEIALGKQYCVKSFSNYINIEKIILNFFKIKFGDKICYKINKVISDTELSFNDNIGFNNLTNNMFNKLSVITTSFNNWDINQTEGIVTNKIIETLLQTQLGKYLHNFDHYYNTAYGGKRILNWFPHFGEVSITYLNQQLTMLPIQFMVVEMFNDVNQIDLHNIQNANFFSNYTQKFRNDIIGSLVTSGMFGLGSEKSELLELQTSSHSSHSNATVMVLLNSKTINNNLIEIFLNTSDYKSIWENNRIEELIHTREEITSTVINHVLKNKSNPLLYDELFTFVKKSIILFELDDLIFTKTIDYMIKQDYIRKLDNLSYEKRIY
jgi:hypothetical protein